MNGLGRFFSNFNLTMYMDTLKIDRTKLYTQSAYANKIRVSRARVNQMINEGILKTAIINGATLVYDN